MTPFDLEKAKKGHPVKTRYGWPAKFITHLQGGQPAPLLFDIQGNAGISHLENYFLDGKHDGVHENPLDLFME